MYVQLNHFAVHMKLTQHCKPAILQLKKLKLKKMFLKYVVERKGKVAHWMLGGISFLGGAGVLKTCGWTNHTWTNKRQKLHFPSISVLAHSVSAPRAYCCRWEPSPNTLMPPSLTFFNVCSNLTFSARSVSAPPPLHWLSQSPHTSCHIFSYLVALITFSPTIFYWVIVFNEYYLPHP